MADAKIVCGGPGGREDRNGNHDVPGVEHCPVQFLLMGDTWGEQVSMRGCGSANVLNCLLWEWLATADRAVARQWSLWLVCGQWEAQELFPF